MQRIGHFDVLTTLERLHLELKAQTRDSKVDQHTLLRKSFHYVTATLYKAPQLSGGGCVNSSRRKLGEVTHRVLQELFALLVGGDGFAPPRIRILAAALARELSAGETPYFFRDNFGGNFAKYDQNKVQYFLPVLSEQSGSDLLIQNVSNLVSWFTADADHLGLKMVALSNLVVLAQRFPNVLDKDKHIRPVESKFMQILTGASLESRKTSSTTLFGIRLVSTSSACPVTELDGTPSHSFFTCINNSFDYSEDQILNVQVFSSLYHWIFHLYQAQLLRARKKQSREDIITKLEHFGLVNHRDSGDIDEGGEYEGDSDCMSFTTEEASVLADHDDCIEDEDEEVGCEEGASQRHTSAAQQRRLNPIGMFTLDEAFQNVVIRVCLRVLLQVERDVPMDSVSQMQLGCRSAITDVEWTKEFTEASSLEAVRILDLLCLMDPSLVSSIFPAVKKVYERTASRHSGLVFAGVLQFFVNHGQHVIFDVDPVLHHFFVDYVSVRYRHQLLAMSTLLFLTTNTSKMLLHTPVFQKYYPGIIKLLAWQPRTVASEILPLLPAMIGPTTFVELFHTLLDLPLTASLMEQCDRVEEPSSTDAPSPIWMGKVGPDKLPTFRIMQQYILRNEAGAGGTNSPLWETQNEAQMGAIRALWKNLPVTPRVSSVCKLVPRFLSVYFNVLLANAPPSCIERVVPLLLQTFAFSYPVDFFRKSVHQLVIDTLQAIFQRWPRFLISLRGEIAHAIFAYLDTQGQLLVLHLCWIVGELLNPALCADAKGDVGIFFDALERLAYEAITVSGGPTMSNAGPFSTSSVTASIGAQEVGRGQWSGGGGSGVVPTNTCTLDDGLTDGTVIPKSAFSSDDVGDLGSEGEHYDEPEAHHTADEDSILEGGNVSGIHNLSNVGAELAAPTAASGGGVSGGICPSGDGASKDIIFTPRFVAVIVAALTKLGTKFSEFAPRVIFCLLRMRHHFEGYQSDGVEFVRDRLTDSLQLLRHSAISSSIYLSSQTLEAAETNRCVSVHRSPLSSIGHLSHNPLSFTVGALFHNFELPLETPMALMAGGEHDGHLSGKAVALDLGGDRASVSDSGKNSICSEVRQQANTAPQLTSRPARLPPVASPSSALKTPPNEKKSSPPSSPGLPSGWQQNIEPSLFRMSPPTSPIPKLVGPFSSTQTSPVRPEISPSEVSIAFPSAVEGSGIAPSSHSPFMGDTLLGVGGVIDVADAKVGVGGVLHSRSQYELCEATRAVTPESQVAGRWEERSGAACSQEVEKKAHDQCAISTQTTQAALAEEPQEQLQSPLQLLQQLQPHPLAEQQQPQQPQPQQLQEWPQQPLLQVLAAELDPQLQREPQPKSQRAQQQIQQQLKQHPQLQSALHLHLLQLHDPQLEEALQEEPLQQVDLSTGVLVEEALGSDGTRWSEKAVKLQAMQAEKVLEEVKANVTTERMERGQGETSEV